MFTERVEIAKHRLKEGETPIVLVQAYLVLS